jgi:porin
MVRSFRLFGRWFVLLSTATTLVAAPPEPVQKPVKLLGFGEGVDREFAKLTDIGMTPFLAYYGVYQGNPVGGVQEQRSAYNHLILFGATLDFDKLVGLPGGSLFVSGAEAEGKSLSDYIVNINIVSEAFVMPHTLMFYELYWKQMLFEDKLELRLGRMTPADQFASVPAFGLQVSGGINGYPTSLFVNAPFRGSPNATWGAFTKFHVTKEIYAEAGIYQASDRFGKLSNHGLDFTIRSNDGELVMGQVGWEPTFCEAPERTVFDKNGNQSLLDGNLGLPGDYILGGYYSNFVFPELHGSKIQHSAFGFYAMGQQMLWRSAADPSTNFSVWGGLTFSAQQDISLLPLMGFAGTIWQGFVPRRDRDQLLLTYLISGFSRDYADAVVALGGKRPTAEQVLEASYAIYITNNYTIQPDIQYVIRPNGVGNVTNSLVIGIQFIANY